MKDRVSLYPGRIRLIPVEGQDNVYDLVRADEPIEEGTPLNKVNLLKDSTIQKYVNANINVPDDVFNYLGNYAEYWWKRINAGIVSYVHSTDRNAYPDTGELNGFSYEYAGIPFENMPNIPVKIEIGSYVGTGTYGSSNPNSLTFSFVPKVAIMLGCYVSGGIFSSALGDVIPIMLADILTTTWTSGTGFASSANNTQFGKKSSDGKTFSWYTTYKPSQYNDSGKTYYVLAIG